MARTFKWPFVQPPKRHKFPVYQEDGSLWYPTNSNSTRRREKKSASEKRALALMSKFSRIVVAQEGKCFYCHEIMGVDCTKEHLLAKALGGTNFENIVAAHGDCNSAVGHLPVRVKILLAEYGRQMGRVSFLERARKIRQMELRRTFKLGEIADQRVMVKEVIQKIRERNI